MSLMPEPVPAADETVAANAAQTAPQTPPETAAAPTQGTAEADLAWSGGDDDRAEPAPERQSWVATWRKAGALLLGGLALGAAIVLGFWLLEPKTTGPQPPPQASHTPTSASPSTSAAPPSIASTPEQDNKYVQDLNDRGISFANPEAAIYNGKLVCEDVRQGMTVPQIVDAFRASNPGLGADAQGYVAISIRTYCPQNANLVSGIS